MRTPSSTTTAKLGSASTLAPACGHLFTDYDPLALPEVQKRWHNKSEQEIMMATALAGAKSR